MLPIADNEDRATCRACGGRCCKTLPGAYLPGQLTPQEVQDGLASGDLALAWWDGDPRPEAQCFDVDCPGCPRCQGPDRLRRAYYLRPRHSGSSPGPFDRGANGVCRLLGPEGCTLPFQRRPAGCQNLLVNRLDPGNCHEYAVPTGSFRHYAAVAWIPFQDAILAAASTALGAVVPGGLAPQLALRVHEEAGA
ncbi:MAG: hypothetical protein ACYDBQ_12190 [Thermoplasmatota archaeon]